ncbi:hypothetical protein JX265_013527 [Neoarthrinium moseri]|uniref:Uncharacterized protein n=1 Tax=Neoarthrinium moseri TaxID=1658444 RepID=A0A9P9W8U5_9PEZI|nr:hypothetical protein JX266_013754 [Neoarthrinium moseri]KAI1849880.1 hypothetical protein JX265_013527 [Neoarthrinium moseri]
MATEATGEKPVDPQTATPADPEPQHADSASAPPAVNGTAAYNAPDTDKNRQIADIVDDLVHSAEVSVSGGSDTEASASRVKLLPDGHARSSSTAKKPSGFKSVSVNRTFLGAKNAANATSRSESTSPSVAPAVPSAAPGSSGSKLKLVAKSGSSLGGSTKTLTTNGKAPPAPDASSVWNKNRPVPVPEPKKLSDEELMSKYGIHMADRLRPEDDKGQSNWADIDDDEEWAPDTITWTDGTKITLPQVDDNPPLAAPAAVLATSSQLPPPAASSSSSGPPKSLGQAEKPKSPAPVPTPAPAPAPAPTTGATTGSARASPSVKAGVLASGKSLVLKGAPEKPTLVAKAPAPPTPVKSPWAPLPPIEKASPVLMDLPLHQQQPPPPTRGYPPRDPSFANSGPPPAKEIAADDFTRAPWRDGQPGAGGNRELFNSQSGRYEPVHDRRGSRHDPAHRQPHLLQRPSLHEQQGPAEPSAAFQTSRTSHDAMPYGRRRTSSNVSGVSAGFLQRLPRPSDTPSLDGQQSMTGPGQPSPARSQPAQPWQARPSPAQTHAVPQLPVHDVPPAAQLEDDIELQKKLMRERRELAIKRRLEEEAREEAAKQERIRLKLEAMGPPPERKSSKKEEPKEATYKRDGPPAGIFSKEDLAAAAAERAQPHPPATSPKKRDVSPAKAEAQASDPKRPGKASQPQRPSPPPGAQPAASWPDAAPQPAERLASWGGGSAHSGSRNVWAAPGNDRSLGNGTFNADIGHLAGSQPTEPASLTARPTPIGPPRSISQNQTQRADPPPGRLPPIGPPAGSRPGPNQAQASPARRNLWATADIAADDRAIRERKLQQLGEHKAILESQGVNTNEAHQPVRDTWRGVNVGQDGKRAAAEALTTVHVPSREQPSQRQDYRQHQGPDGGYNNRRSLVGPAGTAAPGGQPGAQPRAGSRFFPHESRDIRQEETQLPSRSKSPTPPPPTMDDHPAYDGDAGRPHVALPPARPVVKLPPAMAARIQPTQQPPAPIAPSRPASFAAAVATVPRPAVPVAAAPLSSRGVNYGGSVQKPHEIRKQENWQEKINSLVRNSGAPAKPTTVDSSSKSAFDAHTNLSATVSLPALSPTGSSTSESSNMTTKEMAEECFDEQEMGSLPQVSLPNVAPRALWPSRAVEPNWHPLQVKHRVDAVSSESVRFAWETLNHKSVYRICAPGMGEAKTVLAPFGPRNRSNPKRQGRGGRHASRGGQRGGGSGGRDSGDTATTSTSERPERASSGRGRGGSGYRARSENWNNRNASTLAQATQS